MAAAKSIVYIPVVPAAGVPEIVPVPLALSTKVRPLGSVEELPIDGAGEPAVVMANVPAVPTTKVAAAALVNDGPVPTWIERVCTALGKLPLAAVTVIGVVPVAVGVPVMSAVPFAPGVKVSPAGIAPTSLRVGAGSPVVVTANEPVVALSVKNAVVLLVKAGWAAVATVMVNASVAVLPDAFVAEMETGKVPDVAVVGPEIVAVPLTGLANVSPAGKVPVSVMVAAGKPVVVTV